MKKEIYLQQKILDFVRYCKTKKRGKDFISLGIISKKQALVFKEQFGIDLVGYERVLTLSGIRHVFNRHENLTESDFLAISLVIEFPDSVRLGNKPNSLLYRKDLDFCYFYVECVIHKRKKLELKTLYKRKRKTA